ncbi:MAG: PilZ domain-containing protein [Candidatus Omnitrophica bacterium]|nr:PilZ domain-containing protein [Candidatus Omnitrophota bacterium]
MENKYIINNKERRKFLRIEVAVNVVYSVIGNEQLSGEAVTKNISEGGICLVVHNKIDLNSLLSLKIHLPDGKEPIQVTGKVVWKAEYTFIIIQESRYDLGIQFLDISETDRNRIANYVVSYVNNYLS